MAKTSDYGLSRGSKPQGGYGLEKGSRPQQNNNRGGNGGYNAGGYGGNRNNNGYGGGKRNNGGYQSSNIQLGDAKAPYNFVPLNDRVVRPPVAYEISDTNKIAEDYAAYITSGERFSGYFDLEVTNLTPLYIGGANGFFSDGQNVCIPGSSMRGCIKNLFKIITCSAFRGDKNNPDLTDKHLYFRSFTSPMKAFKQNYTDRMVHAVEFVDKNGKKQSIGKSNAAAGFLVKEGKNYYICPAEFKAVKGYGDDKLVWKNDCVEVYTGRMMSKKHFYRIFAPRWNTKYTVAEEIINDYIDDATRKGASVLKPKSKPPKDWRLLKGAEAYSFISPCFYVADDSGDVQHFGASPYYRIPYKKSIGDHIPKAINDVNVIDFADAVFGRKEDWASRVFFEDMYLEKNCDMFNESYHKILGSPNPNSFQLYLNKDAKTGEACTWENGNASIRGYKLYWHTKMDWKDNPKNTNMGTQIAPLKPNHTFKGRIRFENLDAEELGALCYVFALAQEKNTCFKLGMGKSIGMGTIKTSAKLMLRTEEYYSTLFDENGFAACVKEVALNNYKDKFDRYIEKKLTAFGGKSLSLYKERMKELRMILSIANMDNPKWNQTVATMDFLGKGEDKKIANQRKPLPSISEVFGKIK